MAKKKEREDLFEGEPWYRNPRVLRTLGWAAAVVAAISFVWEVLYGGDVALLSSLTAVSISLFMYVATSLNTGFHSMTAQLQELRRELSQEVRGVGGEVRGTRETLAGEIRNSTSTIVAALHEIRGASRR